MWWSLALDLVITLLLWLYFTIGFVVLFSPWYLIACAFPSRQARIFQTLNHTFLRGFFLLCRVLIPRHRWHIDKTLLSTRSSVIVCLS